VDNLSRGPYLESFAVSSRQGCTRIARVVATMSSSSEVSFGGRGASATPFLVAALDSHVGEDQRSDEDVEQSNFEEEIPPKLHKLIVAEAWQSPTHPDEEKE
jgi:hypothetical protein